MQKLPVFPAPRRFRMLFPVDRRLTKSLSFNCRLCPPSFECRRFLVCLPLPSCLFLLTLPQDALPFPPPIRSAGVQFRDPLSRKGILELPTPRIALHNLFGAPPHLRGRDSEW